MTLRAPFSPQHLLGIGLFHTSLCSGHARLTAPFVERGQREEWLGWMEEGLTRGIG